MSQSTQCLGSIVPLEMFQSELLRSTIKSQAIIYTLTGLTTRRESNPSKQVYEGDGFVIMAVLIASTIYFNAYKCTF